MEANLIVPTGTDISVVLNEYPDIFEDEGYDDEEQSYWAGQSTQECDGDSDWMTYDECVEFCGFCEGAIESAGTLIEGNGGWAQGMISRKDFSGLAVSDEQKAEWKARSNRYWAAFERGKRAAARKVVGA